MRIATLLSLLVSIALRAQVWEPLNGPYTTEVIWVEASSNGLVFFGIAQGTFRSPDNGDTWTPMSIGPAGTYIREMVIAPNGHLFANGDSIYRSVDDGLTWAGIATWPLTYAPDFLVVDDDGVLFAGPSWPAVLYKSADEGDTWTSTATPDIIRSLVDGPADTLYAGAGSGMTGSLLRSEDGGATWTALNPASTWIMGVNNSGHVFAVFDGGLKRSTDGGTSWTVLNPEVADALIGSEWTSANKMFTATGTSGVYCSIDNGDTWSSANNGLYSWYIYSIAVNDSDDVFVATKGGVFRSTDNGTSWTMIYSGDDGSHISCLLSDGNNYYFAGVTGVGVFRSLDQGTSWQAANSGMENASVSSIIANSSGHLFATVIFTGERNGVYRSLDMGASWEHVLDSVFVRSVAINSSGHVFVVPAPGSGWPSLLRSPDNGTTWTDASSGLSCSSLRCVALDSNDVILVGGESCSTPMHRSLDDGNTWSSCANGLDTDGTVWRIEVGPSNVLFAAQDNPTVDLYRSGDNAAMWSAAGSGIIGFPSAMGFHSNPGLVLAGTISGAFISGNNGDEWWPFNAGLTNTDVTALAIDQYGYALAGTDGGGVFRAALPVGLVERPTTTYALEQNVPNPSSSSTTISYSLRAAADVVLTVHDVQGRLIAEVVNTRQGPGRHTVEVSTAGLAPGIYTYSLSVDGVRTTRRMAVEH